MIPFIWSLTRFRQQRIEEILNQEESVRNYANLELLSRLWNHQLLILVLSCRKPMQVSFFCVVIIWFIIICRCCDRSSSNLSNSIQDRSLHCSETQQSSRNISSQVLCIFIESQDFECHQDSQQHQSLWTLSSISTNLYKRRQLQEIPSNQV